MVTRLMVVTSLGLQLNNYGIHPKLTMLYVSYIVIKFFLREKKKIKMEKNTVILLHGDR